MNNEFWLTRWMQAQTGFHQNEVNPYLQQYWQELRGANKVFVPLCGKSGDMQWLRQQGCAVLGVELSPIAVDEFFEENGYQPLHENRENFSSCVADNIQILCGDYFDLSQVDLANVQAVYDRASLVALPAEIRARYVRHLVGILPAGTKILLVTFDYPQEEMDGPPFAVSIDEVGSLYHDYAKIQLLAQVDVLAENPRFGQRGLSRLHENIFLLILN